MKSLFKKLQADTGREEQAKGRRKNEHHFEKVGLGIFRGKQKGELNLLSADTAREGFAKRKRKKSNRPDRSINQIYQDRWGAFAKAISADIVREGFAKRKRKKSCRSDRSTKQIFKDRRGAVAKAISADIARKGFAKRQPLASTPKRGWPRGLKLTPRLVSLAKGEVLLPEVLPPVEVLPALPEVLLLLTPPHYE